MADLTCRVLVIGAGPAGYVCAVRAGQLGLDTIIVDKAEVGGTCLNVGCIPSKALIHAAEEFHRIGAGGPFGISVGAPEIDLARTVEWKDGIVARLTSGVEGLLKKAGVRRLRGAALMLDGKRAQVTGPDGVDVISAEAVVLATGASPVALPNLPFGGPILSSTEALDLAEVPKRLAVVGAGYIGLEIGTAYAKLGAEVTVVEAEDRILPQYDAEISKPVARRLQELGVRIVTGARADGYADGALQVDGEAVPADRVLVAVGREPAVEGWGLDDLGLDRYGRFIAVNGRCQTSMRGVYAIGDVTGEPMLAHRGMAQGAMVAEILAGQNREWDARVIPAVCFTDPEIVSARADEAPGDMVTARFPLAANGRTLTLDRSDGFVRVSARASDHVIVALDAVGAGISELSATFGALLEMGARLEDVGDIIHAHPTIGEAVQEAALKALGSGVAPRI